jgi:hypothetical protein
MATYTSAYTGEEIDRRLAYVGYLEQLNSEPVGIKWDMASSSPTLTRVDINKNPIDVDTTFFNNHQIWGNISRCVFTDPTTGEHEFGNNARGDGLDLTGASGPVMVRVPTGMVLSEIDGTDRYWWVAPLNSELSPWENHPLAYQRGGVLHDEIFVSAYEAYGYLDPNDAKFKLGSATGKTPITGSVGYPNLPNDRFTIDGAETYAGNVGPGWGCLNIHTHTWLQLLMYIEAGTFDTQTAFGRGVVDLASGVNYAGVNTGADSIDTNLAKNGTGTGTGPDGQTPIAWRGIENPWGNIWKFGIGFNTTDTEIRVVNRDGTGVLSGQLAAGNYEVSVNPPYVDPEIGYTSGYISDFESEELLKNMFVPSAISGTSSTRACDFHLTHYPGRTNILLLGGYWANGSHAGVGSRNSNHAVSNHARYIGARLEFIPQEGVV